jgi:hypothetical protein
MKRTEAEGGLAKIQKELLAKATLFKIGGLMVAGIGEAGLYPVQQIKDERLRRRRSQAMAEAAQTVVKAARSLAVENGTVEVFVPHQVGIRAVHAPVIAAQAVHILGTEGSEWNFLEDETRRASQVWETVGMNPPKLVGNPQGSTIVLGKPASSGETQLAHIQAQPGPLQVAA